VYNCLFITSFKPRLHQELNSLSSNETVLKESSAMWSFHAVIWRAVRQLILLINYLLLNNSQV